MQKVDLYIIISYNNNCMDSSIWIYLSFFVLLAVCSIFYKSKFMPLICVGLFVFLFVFAEVGADYISYKYIYQQGGLGNFEVSRIEKLYLYINYVFNKIGFSYELFRICILTISLLTISFVIKKTSPNFAFSFLILYGFNIIYLVSAYRQLITMAIFVLSVWLFFYKDKKIIALLLNIIAIFIHNLAILQFAVLLIVYLLELKSKKGYRLKLKLKNVLLGTCVCIVIRLISCFVLSIDEVKSLLFFVPSVYLSGVSFINKGLLSRLGVFLIVVFLQNYSQKSETIERLLFIYFFAMMLYFIVPFELIMGRLINNFRLLELILIPYLFASKGRVLGYSDKLKENKIKIVLLTLLIVVIFAVFYNQITTQGGYTPIKHYFLGEI